MKPTTGNYEVVHHSQFPEWLVDQGRLDLSAARLDEPLMYHDSCYLGRHNDVHLATRKVIGSFQLVHGASPGGSMFEARRRCSVSGRSISSRPRFRLNERPPTSWELRHARQ